MYHKTLYIYQLYHFGGYMQEYRKTRHAVFLVTYHIVFVTKYRRQCFNDELGERLKSYCTDYINRNGGHVHAIECDRDHMHIMAELPTTISVAFFLGSLKGNSAKFAQREFRDHLKQFYLGEKQSLWSDSYFVASTGGVTMDVIKQYVESQPTKKRPRGRQKRDRG